MEGAHRERLLSPNRRSRQTLKGDRLRKTGADSALGYPLGNAHQLYDAEEIKPSGELNKSCCDAQNADDLHDSEHDLPPSIFT